MFTFVGGPYDGLKIDHNDVNLYADVTPMPPHAFVTLPPFAYWDAVKRGEIGKNGPFGELTDEKPFGESKLIYERVMAANGFQFHFDADGKRYDEAMYGGGNAPPPQIDDTGRFFKCCRHMPNLGDGYSTVTDEKDRVWKCKEITKLEFDSGDAANDILALLGGEPSKDRPQVIVMRCDNELEMQMKLSDVID